MSTPHTFTLPDLGEGLPDATIVEWFVAEGDSIRADQPLVAMETAKAVVEVPAPVSGNVLQLGGAPGDVIATGALLAQFDCVDSANPTIAGPSGPLPSAATQSASSNDVAANAAPAAAADSGTVVGTMHCSDAVRSERVVAIGGIRAMPAVRALARKLGVDLAQVQPSGPDGAVAMADVKQAAAGGRARPLPSPAALRASTSPTRGRGDDGHPNGRDDTATSGGVAQATPGASSSTFAGANILTRTNTLAGANTLAGDSSLLPRAGEGARRADEGSRSALSASGRPMRTRPPGETAIGQPEQLKGVRRNMARVMAAAHAAVVPTTLTDDADIHAWQPSTDVTARLVRAIVTAAQAVPALNAWFDGETLTRTVHAQVDIGIAVDTDDGLFVPVLRNADMLDAHGVRESVDRLRQQVEARTIAPSELSGGTISLSNFGMFAGRYATPVVVPPSVVIIAAGRARHQLVPVIGGIETHRMLPLSLSFDHRACTGGEAARFLRVLLDDLALPQ